METKRYIKYVGIQIFVRFRARKITVGQGVALVVKIGEIVLELDVGAKRELKTHKKCVVDHRHTIGKPGCDLPCLLIIFKPLLFVMKWELEFISAI